MEQRLKLTDLGEGFQHVLALEHHVRSRIDSELLELVKLRASMLNGCAHCIDMHSTEAMNNGEDVRRLFALAAWRESAFFTDTELAALALTDAVTRLDEQGVPDDVFDAAVTAFGTEGVGDLALAIATINVWNRLAITAHAETPAL